MTDQEKQWVNVSKNPVYLADGSLLAPGEAATEKQAKDIAESLFAKSGAIALSAPSQESIAELEGLKLDFAHAQAKIKSLEEEVAALKKAAK